MRGRLKQLQFAGGATTIALQVVHEEAKAERRCLNEANEPFSTAVAKAVAKAYVCRRLNYWEGPQEVESFLR